MGQNDVGRERDQFCRVSANVGSIGGGPARVDADVAADGPSHQSQSLMERCEASLKYRIVCGGGQEHADAPDAIRLLRPCRERPRRRSADKRDEMPPLHGLVPQSEDHGPSIAGLGVTQAVHRNKSGPLCPLWVYFGHCGDGRCMTALPPMNRHSTAPSERPLRVTAPTSLALT